MPPNEKKRVHRWPLPTPVLRREPGPRQVLPLRHVFVRRLMSWQRLAVRGVQRANPLQIEKYRWFVLFDYERLQRPTLWTRTVQAAGTVKTESSDSLD